MSDFMRYVRCIREIYAAALTLLAAAVESQGQPAAAHLRLTQLGPEWAELIVTPSPGAGLGIEVSEDLSNWQRHLQVDTRLESLLVYDPDASRGGARRFYRGRVPGLSVDEARAAWHETGLQSYTYHFRRLCFCVPGTPREADITVRNGQVSSVTNVVYVPSPDPSEEPPEQPDLSKFQTIDGLFALIEEATLHADSVVVLYDLAWDFPRRIAIDEVFEIVDDEEEYAVEALTPVNNDTP